MKSKRHLGKIIFFFIFFNILESGNNAYSQIAIEWQKCMTGGTPISVCLTTDGGFIIGARNFGGGMADFGLIKTDSVGNKIWSYSYGGSFYENPYSAIQCMDGGFIIAGSTQSNDGDVTGNHGALDAWIIKTDSNGTLLWQRACGGSENDIFESVIQNQDGEYIAVGVTFSDDGDLSGQFNTCSECIWMVRFDSTGTIIDQSFPDDGWGTKIIHTNDNGYAIIGSGSDGINGSEFEIIKFDSLYNIQWNQLFGGSGTDWPFDIIQSNDGLYIIAGITSSNDIFVSGNHGNDDNWVIKLDANGNFIWQRCLGRSNNDYCENVSIVENGDNHYIVSSTIYNKNSNSNDSIAIVYGGNDIWLTSIDSSGAFLWEKTLGGGRDEGYFGAMIKFSDHSFVLTESTGSNDFDLSGNIYGGACWLVKFMDEPNTITGRLYVDANSNLNCDSGEYALPFNSVKETGSGKTTFSNVFGNYRLGLGFDGNCNITTDSLRYYNCLPSSYTKTFTGFNNIDSINDFAFQPAGPVNDLKVELTNVSNLRPGFLVEYRITITNTGTSVLSGNVMILDTSMLAYSGSSLMPVLIAADSIQWNFSSLNPFESRNIDVSFMISSSVITGSLVQVSAIVNPIAGDSMPQDNVAYNRQIVVGSFDPNDISVNEDTLGLSPEIKPENLEYTIRFQNTGTAPATFVRITNPISGLLDMASFELISASDNVVMNYFQHSRHMEFFFSNINLPDSNINEKESHGFIRYRIKPIGNIIPGDSIVNQANIYFDYNPNVATNITNTVIINCHSYLNVQNPPAISCFGDTLASQAIDIISLDFTWYIDSVFYSNNEIINLVNLPSGNYNLWLFATNNFCNLNQVVNMTVNPKPALNLGSDTSTCILPIVVNAGAGFNGYQWNTGATSQMIVASSTNSYIVTVTDLNGCKNTDSVAVSIHDLPFVDLGNDTSACIGLTMNAGSGFSGYLWSNGATLQNILVNATNIYSVLVTDSNGCSNTDSINISINPLPTVTLNVFNTDTICLSSGQQMISSGNPPGGTLSGNGVAGNLFDPNTAGVGWCLIAYEYTDTMGCSNVTIDSIFVDNCLGVNSYQNDNQIKIYPNPATTFIKVLCNKPNISYDAVLYDIYGHELINVKINQKYNTIDISQFVGGNYLLKLFNENKVNFIQRIVKLN